MCGRSIGAGVICILLFAVSGGALSQPGDGTQSIYAFLLCGDANGQALISERGAFQVATDRMLRALQTGWKVPAANIAPPCYAWENTVDEFGEELERLVGRADADDIIIFYYAGHGNDNGPSPEFMGDVSATTFAYLDGKLSEATCDIVLILDSCKAGGAVSRMRTDSRWFIASADEGQTICVRSEGIGLAFTKYFTDAIIESAGGAPASLREAYDVAVEALRQVTLDWFLCSLKFGPADTKMWPESGDLTPVHGTGSAAAADE